MEKSYDDLSEVVLNACRSPLSSLRLFVLANPCIDALSNRHGYLKMWHVPTNYASYKPHLASFIYFGSLSIASDNIVACRIVKSPSLIPAFGH